MMSPLLLKVEVWRGNGLVQYRWHCRLCNSSQRARPSGWNYVKGLGMGHMRRNHPFAFDVAEGRYSV